MGEVSVRVTRRRHALVHLRYMYPVPRDIFACQITQHKPWSMAAAYGQDKAAARGDGRPGFRSDDRCTLSGDRFGTRKNFDFPIAPSSLPPPGYSSRRRVKTLYSTSLGPQLFGPYSQTGVVSFSTGSTIRHASST